MPKDDTMPADPTLLLAHENRISKLEDDQSESQVNIAKLTERIDNGFEVLGDKLDDFKTELSMTSVKVDGLCDQVSALEKKQAKQQALKDKLWKGFWAVIMVIIGAGIKFAFELLK